MGAESVVGTEGRSAIRTDRPGWSDLGGDLHGGPAVGAELVRWPALEAAARTGPSGLEESTETRCGGSNTIDDGVNEALRT